MVVGKGLLLKVLGACAVFAGGTAAIIESENIGKFLFPEKKIVWGGLECSEPTGEKEGECSLKKEGKILVKKGEASHFEVSNFGKGKIKVYRVGKTEGDQGYSGGLKFLIEDNDIGSGESKLEEFESYEIKKGGESDGELKGKEYLSRKTDSKTEIKKALSLPWDLKDSSEDHQNITTANLKDIKFKGGEASITGDNVTLTISKEATKTEYPLGYKFTFKNNAEAAATLKIGSETISIKKTSPIDYDFRIKQEGSSLSLEKAWSIETFAPKVGLVKDGDYWDVGEKGLNIKVGTDKKDNKTKKAGSRGKIKVYEGQAEYDGGFKFTIENDDLNLEDSGSTDITLEEFQSYEIVKDGEKFYLSKKEEAKDGIKNALGLPWDLPDGDPKEQTEITNEQLKGIRFSDGDASIKWGMVNLTISKEDNKEDYPLGYKFTLKGIDSEKSNRPRIKRRTPAEPAKDTDIEALRVRLKFPKEDEDDIYDPYKDIPDPLQRRKYDFSWCLPNLKHLHEIKDLFELGGDEIENKVREWVNEYAGYEELLPGGIDMLSQNVWGEILSIKSSWKTGEENEWKPQPDHFGDERRYLCFELSRYRNYWISILEDIGESYASLKIGKEKIILKKDTPLEFKIKKEGSSLSLEKAWTPEKLWEKVGLIKESGKYSIRNSGIDVKLNHRSERKKITDYVIDYNTFQWWISVEENQAGYNKGFKFGIRKGALDPSDKSTRDKVAIQWWNFRHFEIVKDDDGTWYLSRKYEGMEELMKELDLPCEVPIGGEASKECTLTNDNIKIIRFEGKGDGDVTISGSDSIKLTISKVTGSRKKVFPMGYKFTFSSGDAGFTIPKAGGDIEVKKGTNTEFSINKKEDGSLTLEKAWTAEKLGSKLNLSCTGNTCSFGEKINVWEGEENYVDDATVADHSNKTLTVEEGVEGYNQGIKFTVTGNDDITLDTASAKGSTNKPTKICKNNGTEATYQIMEKTVGNSAKWYLVKK